MNIKQNKVVEPDGVAIVLPLIGTANSYAFISSVAEANYNTPNVFLSGHVAKGDVNGISGREHITINCIIQDDNIRTKLNSLQPLFLRRIVINNTDFPANSNFPCVMDVSTTDFIIGFESDRYIAELINGGLKDQWDAAIKHINTMSLWNMQIELFNTNNIGMIISMEGFI